MKDCKLEDLEGSVGYHASAWSLALEEAGYFLGQMGHNTNTPCLHF